MEMLRERLWILCTKKGIKQVIIAEQLGLSKSTVSRFISGERDLKPIYIRELEQILKKYDGI